MITISAHSQATDRTRALTTLTVSHSCLIDPNTFVLWKKPSEWCPVFHLEGARKDWKGSVRVPTPCCHSSCRLSSLLAVSVRLFVSVSFLASTPAREFKNVPCVLQKRPVSKNTGRFEFTHRASRQERNSDEKRSNTRQGVERYEKKTDNQERRHHTPRTTHNIVVVAVLGVSVCAMLLVVCRALGERGKEDHCIS